MSAQIATRFSCLFLVGSAEVIAGPMTGGRQMYPRRLAGTT